MATALPRISSRGTTATSLSRTITRARWLRVPERCPWEENMTMRMTVMIVGVKRNPAGQRTITTAAILSASTAIKRICRTQLFTHTAKSTPVDPMESHVLLLQAAEAEADQEKFLTTAPTPRVTTILKLLNAREALLTPSSGSMNFLTLSSRKSMERSRSTSSTRSSSNLPPVKTLRAVMEAREAKKVYPAKTPSEWA